MKITRRKTTLALGSALLILTTQVIQAGPPWGPPGWPPNWPIPPGGIDRPPPDRPVEQPPKEPEKPKKPDKPDKPDKPSKDKKSASQKSQSDSASGGSETKNMVFERLINAIATIDYRAFLAEWVDEMKPVIKANEFDELGKWFKKRAIRGYDAQYLGEESHREYTAGVWRLRFNNDATAGFVFVTIENDKVKGFDMR